jgi:Na+-driven multidrug efflux pump
VVTKPFQSTVMMSTATSQSYIGALTGWREALKAISTGCASLLSGYLSSLGDYSLPFYVSSCVTLVQALCLAYTPVSTPLSKRD